MSEDKLRESLVKLAHEHPEMRDHLYPLLKNAEESELVGMMGGSLIKIRDDGTVVVTVILKRDFPRAMRRISKAFLKGKLKFEDSPRGNWFELKTWLMTWF